MKQDIIFYAFRYALGRMTYAPTDVARYIILNKDILSEEKKSLIIREIEEAKEKGQAGMDIDIKEWDKVIANLKN